MKDTNLALQHRTINTSIRNTLTETDMYLVQSMLPEHCYNRMYSLIVPRTIGTCIEAHCERGEDYCITLCKLMECAASITKMSGHTLFELLPGGTTCCRVTYGVETSGVDRTSRAAQHSLLLLLLPLHPDLTFVFWLRFFDL